MINIKRDFIFHAQVLKNGFIFLEDTKRNFDVTNFLNQRVLEVVRFFNLDLDCLQEFLF